MKRKKRVVVAMSGGVDSSVSAAILKEEGYEVIGMMLRLWAEDDSAKNRCCAPSAVEDARAIANQLDIPFYVRDYKEVFYNKVVSYYLHAHQNGITPNPCIQCNKKVRFGTFLNEAIKMDSDFFATGHYARIKKKENKNTDYELLKAIDHEKDQSYMLHRLNQEQLSKSIFPLGSMIKAETRKIADSLNLVVHDKPDSQDLCFLGKGGQKGFLSRNLATNFSGEIVDTKGHILGKHTGLANYTVGQRKGLGISWKEGLYVIALDQAKNQLIVGTKTDALIDQFTIKNLHFISQNPHIKKRIKVKIRYKSIEISCQFKQIEDDLAHIILDLPQIGIAPGQSAVLYDGETTLGGGIIC